MLSFSGTALRAFVPETAVTPMQHFNRANLGSGLIDHSQKMMVAARTMAEKEVVGQRS